MDFSVYANFLAAHKTDLIFFSFLPDDYIHVSSSFASSAFSAQFLGE